MRVTSLPAQDLRSEAEIAAYEVALRRARDKAAGSRILAAWEARKAKVERPSNVLSIFLRQQAE